MRYLNRHAERIVTGKQRRLSPDRLYRTVGRCNLNLDRSGLDPVRLDGQLHTQGSDLIVEMQLLDVQVIEAEVVIELEPRGLPDAERDNARSPIPAVLITRL